MTLLLDTHVFPWWLDDPQGVELAHGPLNEPILLTRPLLL